MERNRTRGFATNGIAASMLLMVFALWGCQSAGTLVSVSESKVLFAIGQEDKSDREFRSSGFMGSTEYRCRVGVDCSTETFPAYLNRAGNTGYAYGGVERIIIVFRLDQAYNNVILRLARGGDETTVVRVDRRKTYLVTNQMLGSGEGYRVGVYNLKLGALKKGRHRIEMTVADDGKGNATYQWDALVLFSE
jgi:hypothetical protein